MGRPLDGDGLHEGLQKLLALPRPGQITRALEAAHVRGELPRRDGVTFAYMLSPLPQVSSDAGTPFTVMVIPVDERLTVRIPQ